MAKPNPVVQAKFKCWRIERNNSTDPGDQTARVQFIAAYEDGRGVNAEWSKYTPAGSIEMFINNPSAVDRFEEGKEYLIDFIPADTSVA